jgi:hypothetical protein
MARALGRVLVLPPIQSKEYSLLAFQSVYDVAHLQARYPVIEWSLFQDLVLHNTPAEQFALLQVCHHTQCVVLGMVLTYWSARAVQGRARIDQVDEAARHRRNTLQTPAGQGWHASLQGTMLLPIRSCI